MTHYAHQGDKITVYPGNNPLTAELKAGYYSVSYSKDFGFYLVPESEFKAPDKIYGDYNGLVSKYFTSFEQRTSNTGVLLSGSKGAGKTLIAKLIAKRAIESNYPVIIINNGFNGLRISDFLATIDTPCVIILEEFEKNFPMNRESKENLQTDIQYQFLSLMDGFASGKKLFVVTINDEGKILPTFYNRPGRFLYWKKFKGLELEAIFLYLKENLNNQEYLNEFTDIIPQYYPFTMDKLKAIVEECNRWELSPNKVIEDLNIVKTKYTFSCSLYKEGEKIRCKEDSYSSLRTEIFEVITLDNIYKDRFLFYNIKTLEGSEAVYPITFNKSMLTKSNGITGIYEFYNPEKEITLIITRKSKNRSSILKDLFNEDE
jgi:ATPase family associated with various cellular activities (AAA)